MNSRPKSDFFCFLFVGGEYKLYNYYVTIDSSFDKYSDACSLFNVKKYIHVYLYMHICIYTCIHTYTYTVPAEIMKKSVFSIVRGSIDWLCPESAFWTKLIDYSFSRKRRFCLIKRINSTNRQNKNEINDATLKNRNGRYVNK